VIAVPSQWGIPPTLHIKLYSGSVVERSRKIQSMSVIIRLRSPLLFMCCYGRHFTNKCEVLVEKLRNHGPPDYHKQHYVYFRVSGINRET
jgi:hypothetical protein